MSMDYSDIIGLPHHTSKTHPRMTILQRAAQFSPFAALKGFDEEIDETARTTEAWRELGEDELQALDEQLAHLKGMLGERPQVAVTYFRPDEKKTGGAYVHYTGHLKAIDEQARRLTFAEGEQILFDSIVEIFVC